MAAAQTKKHEPGLKSHLDKWREDKESGAEYGLGIARVLELRWQLRHVDAVAATGGDNE